jgi:hypothetical protein
LHFWFSRLFLPLEVLVSIFICKQSFFKCWYWEFLKSVVIRYSLYIDVNISNIHLKVLFPVCVSANWETCVICQLLQICYVVSTHLRKQPGLKVFTIFITLQKHVTVNCVKCSRETAENQDYISESLMTYSLNLEIASYLSVQKFLWNFIELIDAQLVKKFHAFHRPWIYISEYLVCLIVLTGASWFTSTLIPLALIPRYKWCFLHRHCLFIALCDLCKTCQF